MFKIGIRLLAARSVRHFRANVRATSQIPRPFLDTSLWERLSHRNGRLSSPLRALSVVALASGSTVHVQADSSEEETVVREQQPATEENEGYVDPASKAAKCTKVYVLDILERIFYKMVDSQSRALLYGLTGANVAVYFAFGLGFFLNRPPKPNPTLIRFLSRNFVLSLEWLSRGRWHVILTNMFAHLTWPHLLRNTLGIFTGVFLCSEFLDGWQIAGLYFGGGLVGGSASMALTKILRKPRYMAIVTGASDGIYALWCYGLCAQDFERSTLASVSFELLTKALLVYIFVTKSVGLGKYIRYGYTGRGSNAVKGNCAAHLGGAVTGLVAYGVSRMLYDSSSDDNERTEREATLVTEDVRE